MKSHPKVSFVIIGRNEEKHLAACISSIQQIDYPQERKEIIFVDNNSTDRSVEIAGRFPIAVIALKEQPSTPGLARNTGLHVATGEYVHFVDGDMTIDPEWLNNALPAFADKSVAAVVGRLQEVHPQKTIYNRFFDLGWRTAPVGEIGEPGGGGMFRAALLRAIGGYDDTLFGAEEIDLGYRLRDFQLKTVRVPHLMARHDMDMKTLGHFWRRGARDGYYEMEMITRYFTWAWPLPQAYIWKMNAQLLAFAALVILLALRPHPALWAAALGAPAFFVLKKARYYYRATGERKMSCVAAFFNYFNMFPLAWGELRFLKTKVSNWCRNFSLKPRAVFAP
jgi:glycosyltransferase involved in cell wall biosynthesis